MTMTLVQTPVEGFTGEVAGVSFVDGVGETDDGNALAYFVRHGYIVDEAIVTGEEPVGFDELTVPELRAYADEAGIDLEGASKKSEIVEAIVTGEAARDASSAEGAVESGLVGSEGNG